ncbi:hypothetical protein SS50377_22147 [Spironucleus salmonicida]|uniref:Transmembrane domain-containing protein n=1 Tax=Spironucleus salmonicida TaxID=348837 RepID=V6LY35_9EUKA|nr:hypothetical protein SS50377_22147 [Spironucleus salmonicida]|eukprot:EST45694.1 Transmembrane domain-containing protein [Spironucleus salmonicida]
MNLNFIKVQEEDLFNQENCYFTSQQLLNQFDITHREIRQLQAGTYMIIPKHNQLLISLNKIPLIVLPTQLLILQLNNDCVTFTSQFSTLMEEVNQSQQIWELAVFETLLLYLNKIMNENYVQILVQFNAFKYQDHTNLNFILQKVKSICQKMENILEDVLQNEQLLAQLAFINQKVILNANALNQSCSDLSSQSKLIHTQSRSKLNTIFQKDYNQDELSRLPLSLEALIDIIDSYKIQFHSIFIESCEMDLKVDLKILQTQIKLDIQRNFIVNFSLNQKIINVALTASSLIGGIFGMNLLNPWSFDRPTTNNSPLPFICSVVGTVTIFFGFLLSLNYLSLPSRNKFADKKREAFKFLRKRYENIN